MAGFKEQFGEVLWGSSVFAGGSVDFPLQPPGHGRRCFSVSGPI